MKRIWTIIGVSDVPSSFRWYHSLFAQRETALGHEYWDRIVDSDGNRLALPPPLVGAQACHLDESCGRIPRQWSSFILPRRRLRNGAKEGTRYG